MTIKLETPRTPRSEPVSPYPGFDLHGSYRPESPPPRVKPEGEEYYLRNRGSIQNWLYSYEQNYGYESPRPVPKCPTSACRSNYKLGKDGTIGPILNGSASARPATAPPRVKPEAEEIASVSRGKRMKVIINKFAQSGPSPRVPRVKPEAEETAEVHKGGRMNNLIHKYGRMSVSARAVPRVKPEAEETAEVSKGKRMDKLIHSYGRQPRSARAVPRVKPEAEDNAELDKGKRMDRLLHKYGRMPLSARDVPRVKSEGEPNYNLDQGKRMDRLIHSARNLPRSPRNPPRVRMSEGETILRKSRGQMLRVFNETGERTCIYKPGIKQKSYLKTQMI